MESYNTINTNPDIPPNISNAGNELYEEVDIEVKVPVDSVTPDMIVSRDVCTMDGDILLAEGVMINDINYSKLMSYRIKDIYVKQRSIKARPPISNTINTMERQKIPVVDREAYKKFNKVYEETTEDIKKSIRAISDGAVIDLQELYELTNGIMSTLPCRTDVFSFISFIKRSSEHTFTHSNNVSLLCNLFAQWLNLSDKDILYVTTAGLLHDIGKTKTPPEILNKEGKLSDEEFETMKQHTVQGFRILEKQNIPSDIKLAALLHHEKSDGSGYPIGMKDEQINSYAKIVTICDIYDAMTANRVYRGKICPFEVIRTFETRSYGELDTRYLLIFLQNIAYSYVGNWVTLSDGREAEVIFINRAALSKPLVKTLDGEFIDLQDTPNLKISGLV